MVFHNIVRLVLFAGFFAGLAGCGDKGNTGPGDTTPPAVSNLDEGKLKQELPARRPAP